MAKSSVSNTFIKYSMIFMIKHKWSNYSDSENVMFTLTNTKQTCFYNKHLEYTLTKRRNLTQVSVKR